MIGPDGAEALDVIAPVAVKLGSNSNPVQKLSASLSHALVGSLARSLVEGARGVSDDEDLVALLNEREDWESDANLGQDTAAAKSLSASAPGTLATQILGSAHLTIICFLPVALTALRKSSLSMALIWPGLGM